MIETLVKQNKNDVYELKIKVNGKLIRKIYNDSDENSLYEIADIAEKMYKLGYNNGIKEKNNDRHI